MILETSFYEVSHQDNGSKLIMIRTLDWVVVI
jgi:hypothetical protein